MLLCSQLPAPDRLSCLKRYLWEEGASKPAGEALQGEGFFSFFVFLKSKERQLWLVCLCLLMLPLLWPGSPQEPCRGYNNSRLLPGLVGVFLFAFRLFPWTVKGMFCHLGK